MSIIDRRKFTRLLIGAGSALMALPGTAAFAKRDRAACGRTRIVGDFRGSTRAYTWYSYKGGKHHDGYNVYQSIAHVPTDLYLSRRFQDRPASGTKYDPGVTIGGVSQLLLKKTDWFRNYVHTNKNVNFEVVFRDKDSGRSFVFGGNASERKSSTGRAPYVSVRMKRNYVMENAVYAWVTGAARNMEVQINMFRADNGQRHWIHKITMNTGGMAELHRGFPGQKNDLYRTISERGCALF